MDLKTLAQTHQSQPARVSLVRLELVPDGSTTPPGDLINVHVLFYSPQDEIDLRIRAFVVSGEFHESCISMRSRREEYRDQNGDLQIISRLTREPNAPLATASIAVPYDCMDLSIGLHIVGYQIEGLRGEAVEFVTASRLTTICVSELGRDQITRRTQRRVFDKKTYKQPAVIVDSGQVVETDIEATVTFERPVFESEQTAANIPGGFVREEVTVDFAHDPRNPLEAYFAELDHRPWIPLGKKAIGFVTNRNVRQRDDYTAERFGIELSDELTFGESLVTIPVDVHVRGRLERPRWWQKIDPKKHFAIERVTELQEAIFLDSVRHAICDGVQDALMFVHGFNNSFQDASLRLAQFVHDIRFPGLPLLFSWPSEGRLGKRAYQRDEERARESATHVGQTLRRLIENREKGGRDSGVIHLLAHSMGNRVLLRAIHEIAEYIDPQDKPFGHIILVAPDMDVASFVSFLPDILASAKSVTSYFCREDKALLASRILHLDKRVGEAPVFFAGLQNVDAERANTSILGHDYFVSKSELLIDLEMLINMSLMAPSRPTLREVISKLRFRHWMFP